MTRPPTRFRASTIVTSYPAFEREPLSLDASVQIRVGPRRFFPAAAEDLDTLRVHAEAFDQQLPDFAGPVPAQLDRLQRLALDQGFAAQFPEVRDPRVVHMAAEQQ